MIEKMITAETQRRPQRSHEDNSDRLFSILTFKKKSIEFIFSLCLRASAVK